MYNLALRTILLYVRSCFTFDLALRMILLYVRSCFTIRPNVHSRRWSSLRITSKDSTWIASRIALKDYSQGLPSRIALRWTWLLSPHPPLQQMSHNRRVITKTFINHLKDFPCLPQQATRLYFVAGEPYWHNFTAWTPTPHWLKQCQRATISAIWTLPTQTVAMFLEQRHWLHTQKLIVWTGHKESRARVVTHNSW